MKIQFVKNIQFTKLVKADSRLREFNFRKVNGVKEGRFTVDVSDDRGNRIIFNMIKEDSGWKIISNDSMPDWVQKNEEIFSNLIEDELKNM